MKHNLYRNTLCILFSITVLSCSNTASIEAQGEYLSLKHPGNDQGFINPAELGSVLPRRFDGFEIENSPSIGYKYESDNEGEIRNSGCGASYINADKENIMVVIIDFGSERKTPEGDNWRVEDHLGHKLYTRYTDNLWAYQIYIGSISIRFGGYNEEHLKAFLAKIDLKRLEGITQN